MPRHCRCIRNAAAVKGLKELGDRANDLEDIDDARLRVLLRVEVTVYGNEEEVVGVAGTPDDLYGAYGVEDYGVYFAILYIFEGTFMQGYDVAVVNLWLHGVSCDIAPEVSLFKALYHYVCCGYSCL